MAAKFEFEVMVSPSSARSLFQRALRVMPNEKKLWVEVIPRNSRERISICLRSISNSELLYVELVQKRQAVLDRTKQELENNEEDAVLQGKIVEVVFHNAQATIESKRKQFYQMKSNRSILDDPKFICSFVKILYEFSQFPFVEAFIDHIYSL